MLLCNKVFMFYFFTFKCFSCMLQINVVVVSRSLSVFVLFLSLLTSSSEAVICSAKRVFLKIWKIHRKILVLKSIFNKIEGLSPATFLKMRLRNRCFPFNFAEFLRKTFFFLNTSGDCFFIIIIFVINTIIFIIII